ncbi:MAG: hypothetical protein JKX97_02290 [Candidatus Lindowbacteria bacterium]|nr:hypothetical protein [Candidatus Lindowbacteria bacterium]
MRSRHTRSSEKGFVIPLLLFAIVILGYCVAGLSSSLVAPLKLSGDTEEVRASLLGAESILEQARALIVEDIGKEINLDGFEITRPNGDTCTYELEVVVDRIRIKEKWNITTPLSYVVYARSELALSENTTFLGPVTEGISDLGCNRDLIAMDEYKGLATELYTAADFTDLKVINKVIKISSGTFAPVRIENLEIVDGLLIVEGDLLIQGTFAARTAKEMPLLIVTGNISSDTHALEWTWNGVIVVSGNAHLKGPIDFEGTLIGRLFDFEGEVIGELGHQHQVLGYGAKIRKIERVEERLVKNP